MSPTPTLTRTQERYLLTGSSLTLGLLGGWHARSLWTSRLQRIASVDQLVRLSTAPALRPVRLRGTVTRVGDADNFHLFHRPFWYRKALPVGGKAIKAAGTVHVRLAGVDAPEVRIENHDQGKPSASCWRKAADRAGGLLGCRLCSLRTLVRLSSRTHARLTLGSQAEYSTRLLLSTSIQRTATAEW